MRRKCRQAGSVSLEFMMLFPLVVAVLYATAVYGITFFGKYQMQDAADRAVAAALLVDRSAYEDDKIEDAIRNQAKSALEKLVTKLPAGWRDRLDADCDVAESGVVAPGMVDVEMLECSLTYNDFGNKPIVPGLNFGWLGKFPPLPASLAVKASVAF
ncbi:TadE family protein [Alcanivorax sp. 24]|uniref:TadE family protein n=1 Tax=Alcanivorax sp. 24 TaxID=2545266 RepID=UPI0010607821|nr:TadE family protein [Alcanivorax sp. 24]